MFLRSLNLVLTVAMAVGAVLTLTLIPKQQRLQTEVRRLEAMYGEAFVADPEKFYVRYIGTDKPFHFIWRVHFPKAPRIEIKSESSAGGFGHRFPFVKDVDLILTFAIRQGKGGLETSIGGPSNIYSYQLRAEAEQRLLDGLDKCRMTVAGYNAVEEFSAEEIFDLVSISPTPAFAEELEAELGVTLARQVTRKPIAVRIGLPQAFVDEAKRIQEGRNEQ